MRIAEYKQTGTDTITEQIPILDEFGEPTGQYETVTREKPIMGLVYRDMTHEEEAQALAEAANMPEPEPTTEERIQQLECEADTQRSAIAELAESVLALCDVMEGVE